MFAETLDSSLECYDYTNSEFLTVANRNSRLIVTYFENLHEHGSLSTRNKNKNINENKKENNIESNLNDKCLVFNVIEANVICKQLLKQKEYIKNQIIQIEKNKLLFQDWESVKNIKEINVG